MQLYSSNYYHIWMETFDCDITLETAIAAKEKSKSLHKGENLVLEDKIAN